MQHLVIAGGDFVHQGQLQRREGEERPLLATIPCGDGRCRLADGKARARVLKLHEFDERRRVLAVLEIGGGHTELLQLVDGEVDVTGTGIDAGVGDASTERNGVAERVGAGGRLRVVEAIDMGREHGGRTAGGVAIVGEACEVEIAHLGEIHLGAMQDGVERGALEPALLNNGGKRSGDGVCRGAGEESREFLAPPVELCVGDAGVMHGGVDIGDFLAERVGGVSGVALRRWQLE